MVAKRRADVALAVAGAAALAVPLVGIARGAWLLRIAPDPAVVAERRLDRLRSGMPRSVTFVSCRATRDERLRWAFLTAYVLSPAIVRVDPGETPKDAFAAALARGGTVLVDDVAGARCPFDVDAVDDAASAASSAKVLRLPEVEP